MILTCPTCTRPIVSRNGMHSTPEFQTDAACASCGAIYRISVTQLRETTLTPEELDRRRNRTT